MVGNNTSGQFGLDLTYISSIDWNLAIKRVLADLRSDFIHAPHLGFVYRHASSELIDMLTKQLRAGTFSPGIPMTIEVPKSFRMRVATKTTRLGPPYHRPGSILLPSDRIFYQALADQAASIIQGKTNLDRSFSHILDESNSLNMFLSTRTCWNKLQEALQRYAQLPSAQYVLKVDVANYFGSLNLHTLINILNDSGYDTALSKRLEEILISYTGLRSSRGILQGMYPSDLFGNFYLSPIDRFLDDLGVQSARYVDDIYIFIDSVDGAERVLRALIPFLRSYDLVLNEAKSVIMLKSALLTEEPDLEKLYYEAFEEVSSQLNDEDFDADYGFQSEWDEDEDEDDSDDRDEHEPGDSHESDLELEATIVLFNSINTYPGHEENIERFCLPLFTIAESDYAVQYVMDSFKKRPSMSQIYASYLSKFLDSIDVKEFLLRLLKDDSLMDWQKLWVLAALSQNNAQSEDGVKTALSILKDTNRHDSLRGVAAIHVGEFGEFSRRKELISMYPNVSPYIQAAIYYSSRKWAQAEKANAKKTWGNNSLLHKLITQGIAKL